MVLKHYLINVYDKPVINNNSSKDSVHYVNSSIKKSREKFLKGHPQEDQAIMGHIYFAPVKKSQIPTELDFAIYLPMTNEEVMDQIKHSQRFEDNVNHIDFEIHSEEYKKNCKKRIKRKVRNLQKKSNNELKNIEKLQDEINNSNSDEDKANLESKLEDSNNRFDETNNAVSNLMQLQNSNFYFDTHNAINTILSNYEQKTKSAPIKQLLGISKTNPSITYDDGIGTILKSLLKWFTREYSMEVLKKACDSENTTIEPKKSEKDRYSRIRMTSEKEPQELLSKLNGNSKIFLKKDRYDPSLKTTSKIITFGNSQNGINVKKRDEINSDYIDQINESYDRYGFIANIECTNGLKKRYHEKLKQIKDVKELMRDNAWRNKSGVLFLNSGTIDVTNGRNGSSDFMIELATNNESVINQTIESLLEPVSEKSSTKQTSDKIIRTLYEYANARYSEQRKECFDRANFDDSEKGLFKYFKGLFVEQYAKRIIASKLGSHKVLTNVTYRQGHINNKETDLMFFCKEDDFNRVLRDLNRTQTSVYQ